MTDLRNVVLVHGGFVDGSGWEGVYRLLKQLGFKVSVVQNPTTSLADDVAVTVIGSGVRLCGKRSTWSFSGSRTIRSPTDLLCSGGLLSAQQPS